jgi:hypothetical protein
MQKQSKNNVIFSPPKKVASPENPPQPKSPTHPAYSNLFWRDFYWESSLPDGRKTPLPIEIFGKLD